MQPNATASSLAHPLDGLAKWIWSGEGITAMGSPQGCGRVRYFRRAFNAAAGAGLVVHVSADSRYKLWLNGELVSRGPAKGDVVHQFFETVDLGGLLREGPNVLAAQVMYYGDGWPDYLVGGSPVNIMTACPGFVLGGDLIDADGRLIEPLHTSGAWRVWTDTAYQLTGCRGHAACFGPFEVFDSGAFPWGFQNVGYDDSNWPQARETAASIRLCNDWDHFRPQRLVERMIQPLEEQPGKFRQEAQVTVEPRQSATVVVDAGQLVTGYPHLEFSGDGSVTLTYAEALTNDQGLKGKRDDLSFGKVVGQQDVLCLKGEGTYEPFYLRTFRFIAIEVRAGQHRLRLRLADYVFTAYPFRALAQFESSDPSHRPIWDICWRTARLCSHETYEDCPYYEQLQYGGDTQVQAMIGYYVPADATLARQFLYQFDWSRQPNGLTRSRYPSRVPQTIPYWSLHWAMSVRDYYLHTGDLETVGNLLAGVLAVIDYHDRRTTAEGIIGKLDGWLVADWSPQWNTTQDGAGIPPGARSGQSAFSSLITIAAMQDALELCRAAADAAADGDLLRARAAWLERRIAALRQATHRMFWDPARGLYLDRPLGVPAPPLPDHAAIDPSAPLLAPQELDPKGHGQPTASAYTNVWAILAGMPCDHAALAHRIFADGELCELTMFSQYFACRALAKADCYHLLGDALALWRKMLDWGLSTCPELPDFARTRSDCHAWSAAPLVEFCREVLGVRPLEPGYRRIGIEPKPAGLSFARGRVPITRMSASAPVRHVEVDWRIENGVFRLQASSPVGVPCRVRLPSGLTRDFPAGGKIDMECRL